jgi:hypothetical protein
MFGVIFVGLGVNILIFRQYMNRSKRLIVIREGTSYKKDRGLIIKGS